MRKRKEGYEKRIKNITIISNIIIIVLLIMFFIFFIRSINGLKKQINYIFYHTFNVSSSVNKISSNLNNIGAGVSKLSNLTNEDDYKDIKSSIDKDKNNIKNELKYIKDNYLGPYKDYEEFYNSIMQVESKFDEVFKGAKYNNGDWIKKELGKKVCPLVTKYNKKGYEIIENAQKKCSELNEYYEHIDNVLVIGLVIIALFILIVSTVFKKAIKSMNKKVYDGYEILSVLSKTLDAVFIVFNLKDKKKEFISSNSLRVLGINNIEIEKDKFSFINLIHPDEREEIKELLENANQEEPLEKEFRFYKNNELEPIWLRMNIFPVKDNYDSKSNVSKYIVTISDQTEEKKKKQALSDALTLAQDANRAKGDFLANMSHELRTPMNGIIGMTTLAKTNINNTKKVEQYLDNISISSNHLMMLINDILDMAKIDNGKMYITHELFDFNEMINDVNSMIYQQAIKKELSYNVKMTNIVYKKIIGDFMRTKQILINILSNSVKYTPSGGNVLMEISQIQSGDKLKVNFTISDNGIGMSEEFLKNLFKPFERGSNISNKNIEGTGLGLAITKNLIALLDGTIRVHSNLNKGSKFVIELPFDIDKNYKVSVNDLQNNKLNTFSNSNIKYLLKGKRFLLAEDNDLNAEIAISFLEQASAKVELAKNGKEVLKKFLKSQKNYYDCILMDIQMPLMNGYDATRAIRNSVHDDAESIPIIAMTADAFEENITMSLEAGMDGHISKPIEINVLYNTLKEILINKKEGKSNN